MSDDKREYGSLSIVSQAELVKLLGVSLSTIQRMRKDPRFPKRRAFPGGPKGWLYREIEAFILSAPVDDDIDANDNPELVKATLSQAKKQDRARRKNKMG